MVALFSFFSINHCYLHRFAIRESDKNTTALFLKRERQHTELMHPSKKRYDYIFRERSIDDGSHYDPRLDKYPRENNTNTLRRMQAAKQTEQNNNRKNEKKFNSLKKVRSFYFSLISDNLLNNIRLSCRS